MRKNSVISKVTKFRSSCKSDNFIMIYCKTYVAYFFYVVKLYNKSKLTGIILCLLLNFIEKCVYVERCTEKGVLIINYLIRTNVISSIGQNKVCLFIDLIVNFFDKCLL